MMRMQRVSIWLVTTAILASLGISGGAQSASTLEDQFKNPSDSAKPRAWWHWMSGNVTEPGITADLEWMHRVGIAGMQMFDGDMGAPLFVDKPVIWMSPEWKSAWRHAAAEADLLHMERSMAASGGWSETAGPWVKPEQGMKKFSWSETIDVLWKPPFVVDVTRALKPGSNEISGKVTNLWPNRMIGDLQPGVLKTYTWTDFRPFKADSPLLESGLLGPVALWSSEEACN